MLPKCQSFETTHGKYIRQIPGLDLNKVVQEITQIVANVFSFYAIIAIEHGFSMH